MTRFGELHWVNMSKRTTLLQGSCSPSNCSSRNDAKKSPDLHNNSCKNDGQYALGHRQGQSEVVEGEVALKKGALTWRRGLGAIVMLGGSCCWVSTAYSKISHPEIA